jgi:two-component system sensor histidine kinase ChvG
MIAQERLDSASRGSQAPGEGQGGRRRRVGRRRLISPLTRRVLAVNVLALALLVAGLLYLDEYKAILIDTELQALRTQGEIVAGALGEGAVTTEPVGDSQFLLERARQMVRRLVETTRVRARLFAGAGELLADSRTLSGPGGVVQVEELPPPTEESAFIAIVERFYDRVAQWFRSNRGLEPYRESPQQRAEDYDEVRRALLGEATGAVRSMDRDKLLLSVAVPVQRYKRIIGALLLSTDGREIDQTLRVVRFDILKVFGIALGVTVLLSLYLAGTITRPIRRLAAAAERVRRRPGGQHRIPDFTGRRDEIGELARTLRHMTDALWARMDAIERFAADVSHEIKNPLSSLRSAVETVVRIEDADQQRRLMAIIQEDVQRLDRLIGDISDASRLDAELSRTETVAVDLGRLLTTLADVHTATAGPNAPRVELDIQPRTRLVVPGMEERLGQVFRNVIANAISFSPTGGTIRIGGRRLGRFVIATVEDEGPGIPEASLESIFERFYSARPATEKFGTHSGLGLSISRQIVDAHGGEIVAENRRGTVGAVTGARFIVRLPAA